MTSFPKEQCKSTMVNLRMGLVKKRMVLKLKEVCFSGGWQN